MIDSIKARRAQAAYAQRVAEKSRMEQLIAWARAHGAVLTESHRRRAADLGIDTSEVLFAMPLEIKGPPPASGDA